MAVSLTITDSASDAGDLSTYTFTGRAIGAADATRTVLVGITTRSGGSPTVSSVTIGGNAAAQLVARASTSGIGFATIWALAVPTGTTATIVVNWSGAGQRCQIVIASLTGDYEATPHDTSSDGDADTAGGADLDQDLSLDVVNGGAAFFIGAGGTTGTLNLSYVGATGGTQQAVEALRTLAATLAPVATESPRTVTFHYDTTGSDVLSPASVGVSFAPVAGDTTAPVLSNPVGTATGQTTAALAVDTDEGNGTLFWVVTTSSTSPSGAQVAAGQDHTGAAAADSGSQAVSGTGTQNANATGLTAATTYWAHFVQDDTAANRSNVATSASFMTDSAAVPVTPIEADEGAGGGGRRRGRLYPYPNVIDDGWDWDAPDARAEPAKAEDEPVPQPQPKSPPAVKSGPPAGISEATPQKVGLAQALKSVEEPPQQRPSSVRAVTEGENTRIASLEAENDGLRAQIAELKAKRLDDEEEERLLMLLLEEEED